MKITPKHIKEEGIYQPKNEINSFTPPLSQRPLRYLIENNLVFQDENKDWVLVTYNPGCSNSPDWLHWVKTGYCKNWSINKWKSDTNLDEIFTLYSIETKDGWNRKYFTVKLKNHLYSQHIHPNGYWVETIRRNDVCYSNGEEQLYYKNSQGTTQGKMPVKIGKKIQELKDKGIKFGFYKF